MTRTLSFIVSAGIHGLVLWLFWNRGGFGPPPSPITPSPVEEKETVQEVHLVMPSLVASASVPKSDVMDPINYSGTPHRHTRSNHEERKSFDASESEKREKTTDHETVQDPDKGEEIKADIGQEDLQQALDLYEKGRKAPGYRIEGITGELVGILTNAGKVKVIAFVGGLGGDNADREAYLTSWSRSGMLLAVRHAEYGWNLGFAERAVPLGGELEETVTAKIRSEYGQKTKTYLFLSNDMDIAVLAAQMAACRKQGIEPGQVASTVGRFKIEDGRAKDFIVTEVLSLKGKD